VKPILLGLQQHMAEVVGTTTNCDLRAAVGSLKFSSRLLAAHDHVLMGCVCKQDCQAPQRIHICEACVLVAAVMLIP